MVASVEGAVEDSVAGAVEEVADGAVDAVVESVGVVESVEAGGVVD